MPSQFDPASGTRDFLAPEFERREWAFGAIRSVFQRYGFEPLQTPAFERLDVLLGKYGDEGDKLVFKILRRGEHEASGEADLALRYDMTVPLARVAAAYGSQLTWPYKRYAMGPVWRADRPGKGRFREFVQCDLDTLGSTSPLADAEVLSAHHDAMTEVGIGEFTVALNSRHVLAGLLEAFKISPELGTGVLTSLDKLDKLAPADVTAELAERGLARQLAGELVEVISAPDAADRVRAALKSSDEGVAGLDEVDAVLELVAAQLPAGRVVFTPSLVRGLSYYTGPIWEVRAPGAAGSLGGGGRYDHLIEALGGPDVPAVGSSIGVERILSLLPGAAAGGGGRLDVAVTILGGGGGGEAGRGQGGGQGRGQGLGEMGGGELGGGELGGGELAARSFALAAAARSAGLRASVYLGSSGKIGKQLRWASDQGARWCLIYGAREREAGLVKVRDMVSREEADVPPGDVADYLARAAARAAARA